MDGNEQVGPQPLGHNGPLVQLDEDIAAAGHDGLEAAGAQLLGQHPPHGQHQVLLASPPAADRPRVLPTVAGVDTHAADEPRSGRFHAARRRASGRRTRPLPAKERLEPRDEGPRDIDPAIAPDRWLAKHHTLGPNQGKGYPGQDDRPTAILLEEMCSGAGLNPELGVEAARQRVQPDEIQATGHGRPAHPPGGDHLERGAERAARGPKGDQPHQGSRVGHFFFLLDLFPRPRQRQAT